MSERIFGMAFQLKDKKFTKMQPEEIGHVLADGSIQNTPYKFVGREIRGGIAITTNSTLIEDDGDLVNPATSDRFEPTKSGKGFWNPVKKIFIKKWGSS